MSAATIRPYRPSDHHAGRGLWVELIEHQRSLYDDPTIGGSDPGAAFEDYLTRLELSGVWVADLPPEGVVGLVGLVLRGQAGKVEPIVVTQRLRSRGIGRALLEHVAGEAKRRGLASLTLTPVSRDDIAIRRFHAAGYDVLSAVELTLDLGRPTHDWQDGIAMRTLKFRH